MSFAKEPRRKWKKQSGKQAQQLELGLWVLS
jgi:hypothetical protein